MVSIKKIQNKRSKTKGYMPTSSQLDDGEIAINYFDGDEQIFIRNEGHDLVNFRTDEQNHNIAKIKIFDTLIQPFVQAFYIRL